VARKARGTGHGHCIERDFNTEDLHPIDIVETLAEERSWDFDRIAEDQIAMAIEGSVAHLFGHPRLVARGRDAAPRLRLRDRAPRPPAGAVYKAMALANDKCWSGAFVLWPDQKLMVYRYSLNCTGGAMAGQAQITDMVRAAVAACERFYPAFQLVAWGGEKPEIALGIAMTEAYGRA
jgi:hypothetical protein